MWEWVTDLVCMGGLALRLRAVNRNGSVRTVDNRRTRSFVGDHGATWRLPAQCLIARGGLRIPEMTNSAFAALYQTAETAVVLEKYVICIQKRSEKEIESYDPTRLFTMARSSTAVVVRPFLARPCSCKTIRSSAAGAERGISPCRMLKSSRLTPLEGPYYRA